MRIYIYIYRLVILTEKNLTEAEKSLLCRGLSFCPRPKQVNKTELQKDLDEFGRKIIAKEIFARDEETDVEEFESAQGLITGI